jgi:citrate lyase subunit beta/citryl-CoA lyase
MTAAGQFAHPLVLRAKLEDLGGLPCLGKNTVALRRHRADRHGVVAEAARKASRELGYTRMWSIHPSQIRTIVAAFRPEADEIEEAVDILAAARTAAWAPIGHAGTLHDRASYRYYWRLLLRARNAGAPLPRPRSSASSPLRRRARLRYGPRS